MSDLNEMSVEEMFNQANEEGNTPPPSPVDSSHMTATQATMAERERELAVNPELIKAQQRVRSIFDGLTLTQRIISALTDCMYANPSSVGPDTDVLSVWVNSLELAIPLLTKTVFELKTIIAEEKAKS